MNDEYKISLFDVLRWAVIAGVMIYQYILIINLQDRMDRVEKPKTAFYLVETSTGRHLKLGQIK